MQSLVLPRACPLLSLLLLAACAPSTPGPAAPTSNTTAQARPTAAGAPAPPKPRCAASDPNAPSDIKPVMRQGGGDVKGCFLMGKTTSAPPSVAIELRVAEDGSPRTTAVNASGAERSQLTCAENAIRRLRFSRFCGDDVVVQWTYALAQ